MPLLLAEAPNRSFVMKNEPRHKIERGLRRDNSKLLRTLTSFSDQASKWTRYLLQGPFHNDGSDDFRLAQDKRRERQDFIEWSKVMGKQALYLAIIIKAMLTGGEPAYPPGTIL